MSAPQVPNGALSDLAVLELAQDVAGPWCGKLLADLGADVIKVEPPGGDCSRRHGPFPDDLPHPERSGQFLYLNQNKRGITLDLESARACRIVGDLAQRVDILVTDIPQRQLEERELDYEHLQVLNSRLIMTGISPFGRVGPLKDYVGTDFTSYMMSGIGRQTPYNQVTDLPAQPPLAGGGFQTDYLAGSTAATATMIAVFYRSAYGSGQFVDISAVESMSNMIRQDYTQLSYDPQLIAPRQKMGFPWVLPCKDGHVSFSPTILDHWWVQFKEMMGQPEWAQSEIFDTGEGRNNNADAIEPLMIEWLMQHTKQEVCEMAKRRHVACFPVNSMEEVVGSPQYNARDYFDEVDHPVAGTIKQPGPPVRFSRTPAAIRRPAPQLGEHNEEIFCGTLGYSREELVTLARAGVT